MIPTIGPELRYQRKAGSSPGFRPVRNDKSFLRTDNKEFCGHKQKSPALASEAFWYLPTA
jgi:hypothetical protein